MTKTRAACIGGFYFGGREGGRQVVQGIDIADKTIRAVRQKTKNTDLKFCVVFFDIENLKYTVITGSEQSLKSAAEDIEKEFKMFLLESEA